MEHKTVNSTNLASVGYDAESRKLRVKFKGGTLWEYDDVPAETHHALLHSSSPGAHFHAHVRDKFTGRKIS